MILVRPEDAMHKAQLLRLLTEIADNRLLAANLYFKGGTCAGMLGMLDRFSVDLDFDLKPDADKAKLRREFHLIFKQLELEIKDESKKALEFFVKYKNLPGQRNTIKIDALEMVVKANQYQPVYLAEIDRTLTCQTQETIFANKLVAPFDRYKRHHSIAGRDFYDIRHFFYQGYRYNLEIIKERTGQNRKNFFKALKRFIETRITSTVIDEDLNTLLPTEVFQKARKTLKTELLMFISEETERR